MKYMICLTLLAGALALPAHAADNELTAAEKKDGWVLLFDGKTLNGWNGMEGFWSVKDDAILGAETKDHPVPHNTFLIYTKEKFSDFELHFFYKMIGGNSGVQIRSKVLNEKEAIVGGYQADMDGTRNCDGSIYDEAGVAGGRGVMSNRGEKTHWTTENKRENSKLDKNAEELKATIKTSDWNEAVVIAKGNRITYSINGNVMTDQIDDSPKAVAEGVIALQLHRGFVMEVYFKDIKIKKL